MVGLVRWSETPTSSSATCASTAVARCWMLLSEIMLTDCATRALSSAMPVSAVTVICSGEAIHLQCDDKVGCFARRDFRGKAKIIEACARDAQFVTASRDIRKCETPLCIRFARAQNGLLRVDELHLRSGNLRVGGVLNSAGHCAAPRPAARAQR
jgi:hypothetical protein